MAKKKKIDLGKILAAVAALFGVVAFIMLAAPGASYTVGNNTTTYSCAQLTFGYTSTTSVDLGILGSASSSAEIFKFSFGNLLTYIFLAVGVVFAVLALLGKLGKIAPFVAIIAFLAAAILFFLTVAMCVPASDNADLVAKFKENLSLGAGAIVGGIFAILGLLSSAAALVFKK